MLSRLISFNHPTFAVARVQLKAAANFCGGAVAAICLTLRGRSTKRAKPTTTKFMHAVATKTRCQVPLRATSTLASGTRNADVPFAV